MTYEAKFYPNNQEIALSGSLRPAPGEDLPALSDVFTEARRSSRGVLYLNLKKLRHLNTRGLSQLVHQIEESKELSIKIVVSSVVPWALRRFQALCAEMPGLSVELYDNAFYPGQTVIESDQLIPVLRTQTNIIWKHEKEFLRSHGLKPGMKIADICCGIGDFAVLVEREFAPERVVAVDHAKPLLVYAQQLARDFGSRVVEYQYGDASSLFLEDGSFDFVTSRLSLQIFNQPELILRELKRIVKPEGRVYVTCELMSHIDGYPRAESIGATYRRSSELFHALGMDLDSGPKLRAYLSDAGFEDIRVDMMMITSANTDTEDFAKVAESWREYILSEVCTANQCSDEERQKMRAGFMDQRDAILSQRGFASWPIFVASGRRPA
jgi:ubiquinone/menaquinone biosynthesis C-methylase UbiE